MKPARSILDPAFKYTNAASTDIRKTWAKYRREQAQQQAIAAEQKERVVQLKRGKA